MRVKSENLYSLEHRDGNLYASFNSNPSMLYKYYDVSVTIYDEIVNAASIGQAFNSFIIKAIKPYNFIRRQMIKTGVDPNSGEPIFSLPEEIVAKEEKALEEFDDVIKFLENKGLAKREMDEQGNPRVTFLGEYAKELSQYFKVRNK